MVITTLDIEGLDEATYEAIGATLPPGPAAGIVYHACGPIENGWRIVDIWRSEALWEAFTTDVYLPAVARAGVSGRIRRDVVPAHDAGVAGG